MRAILLLATTAAASPLAPMWAQLRENARLGALANTTECHVRLLTYEYALGLQAERAPMLEVFDALELNTTCGVARPDGADGARAAGDAEGELSVIGDITQRVVVVPTGFWQER